MAIDLARRTWRAPRSIVRNFVEDPDWHSRERRGFVARFDDGQPGTRAREDERRHSCAGERHVHPDGARGRSPPQFLANGLWRAEQPPEAADIDRHQVVAVPFVARRKIVRDRDQRAVAMNRRAPIVRRTFASSTVATGRRWPIQARVTWPNGKRRNLRLHRGVRPW